MKSINEILKDYTAGEVELEETNAALKEAGASYHLVPGRNVLTEEDRRETSVGYYPEQANGWGLLDTGTGTMDKVHVVNGQLDHAVNEVLPDRTLNMDAYVTICGKTYAVVVDTLFDIPDETGGKGDPGKIGPEGAIGDKGATGERGASAHLLPDRADLRRRTDLAGQMVDQYTKSGVYRVTYDMQGYALRAVRLEAQ